MIGHIDRFGNVLNHIAEYSTRCWVYLPSEGKWNLDSDCAVLESEEVPPEKEDEADAGVPELAKQNRLRQALTVTQTQNIVRNAKMQVPNINDEKLFEAFTFYFDNDAYIRFERT